MNPPGTNRPSTFISSIGEHATSCWKPNEFLSTLGSVKTLERSRSSILYVWPNSIGNPSGKPAIRTASPAVQSCPETRVGKGNRQIRRLTSLLECRVATENLVLVLPTDIHVRADPVCISKIATAGRVDEGGRGALPRVMARTLQCSLPVASLTTLATQSLLPLALRCAARASSVYENVRSGIRGCPRNGQGSPILRERV